MAALSRSIDSRSRRRDPRTGPPPRDARRPDPSWRPRGQGRRRCADRRAVDDEHRHGRRDRHRDPGQGARAGRLRTRAHHGQLAGSGARGRCDPRPARPHGHRRAAGRRLPLQRPQAADAVPRLRCGAVEVPHQPGQRRLRRGHRQQARRQLRADDRGRLPARQAGAHRRQLGQPRPGAARARDGRERAARRAARCAGRDGRGARHVGDRERDAGRGGRAARATRSSCRARCRTCRT